MSSATDFLKRVFTFGKIRMTTDIVENGDVSDAVADISLTEYGIFTVVDYIATLMQQAQWITYADGKPVKGEEYYTLNIKPNYNQSASSFWHEVVSNLLLYGNALIFEVAGQRFVADMSICPDEGNGVSKLRFDNIGRGTYRVPRVQTSDDVLYFRSDNAKANAIVRMLCDNYAKLASSAASDYINSGGRKGVLNIDAHQTGTDEQQAAEMKLLQERFKAFFNRKNATMPLKRGYEYKELAKIEPDGYISDITSLRAEALKSACTAYHLPYSLLSGEVAGIADAWELSMATVFAPLKGILETETNAKIYSKADILNGKYAVCDISKIKPVNILDSAERIDKLISSGFVTINEVREAAGIQRSDDENADKHFITKNYQQIEGGE